MRSQLTLSIEIYQKVFLYLFSKISYHDLSLFCKDNGIDAKDLLSGYVTRNCKFFIYAKSKDPSVTHLDFNIGKRDAKMLSKIARNMNIDNGCRPWTLAHLEHNECCLVSEVLDKWIAKFVAKKMAFLVQSYGLARHDLEADLKAHALHALHKAYPFFETELHAINTVKRAVHNKGIDLIKQHTRKRNQRLIQHQDGVFEAVNVPITDEIEAPTPFAERYRDERQALDMIRWSMDKTSFQFITLARGDYDADFSRFLGVDNTEQAEANYPRYLNQVSAFLGLSKERAQQILGNLRKAIS